MTRPVTQTLLEQLRRTILGHTIVMWLDKDGHYTELADELAEDGPERVGAPVVGYRGSYLELMRRLAPMTDGVDPSPLLVHVPGANQDSIRQTPLLELNDAGYQFRKALDTLIREAATGRVTPDEVDAFLSEGEPSLEAADAWMAQRVAAADDATERLLRGTDAGRLIHDLFTKGPLERELNEAQLPEVWRYLATQTGLPPAWPSDERRRLAEQGGPEAKRRLADVAAAWVLCVEYVYDLKRPPKAALLQPARELARPLIDACRAAAEHLRETATKDYVYVADEIEEQIQLERSFGEADELGRIDTFRFEEDRLLVAALDKVSAREWDSAAGWAAQRLGGKSVWLDLDPTRRKTWALIERATQLGRAVASSSLSFADARDIDEAARRYAKSGAAIDGLHRAFEQQAERELLGDPLPHVERVREAVDATRAVWREWADRCAREWSSLCENEGALPDAGLQQRTVFEQVVEPLLDERERTALFLVDAMRYEMGQELYERFRLEVATNVHLGPRLAELPTVTEVGMNALVPTAQRGRLHPLLDGKRRRIQGIDAGGFQVKTRAQRETLLGRRAGGVRWYELDELLTTDASITHQIAKSRLVVVHSIQIDKAGEAGNGLVVFPGELRRIQQAWERLRAAGVRRFVLSSDHGFLLRDPRDRDVIRHGQGYDALPRFALYPGAVNNDEQLGLSLRSLGYEDADEAVVVPRGLAVYQSGRERKFVHGGNSPQERVIPVLTIVHKQAVGGEDQRYRVEIEGGSSGTTSHELRACVVRAGNQTTLDLDVEPVSLELRAAEGVAVAAEVIECEGAALDAGLISARVGESFRLRFRLGSGSEQRVRVELVSASAKRRVDAALSQVRFTTVTPARLGPWPVAKVAAEAPAEAAPVQEPTAGAWLEEFDDPGVRKVMAHIAEHNQVSESDLVALLGSTRKARKFARNFDDYREQAPFLLEQTHTAAGKVYQKVTDKK